MPFIKILISTLAAVIFLVACGKAPPADPPNLAGAKDSLSRGHHWYERGCYMEARRFYQEALAFARLSDNVPLLISAQNSLGAVGLAQKNPDMAAAYLEEALQSSLSQQERPDLDRILGNLGSVAYTLKKYKQAEELWLQAIEAANAGKRSPAVYYCNLSRLYLDLGRQEDFESMLAKSLLAAEADKDMYARADAYNLAGRSAMAAGKLADAEDFFKLALDLDRKTENSHGLAQDNEFLGLLMQKHEKWSEAAGFFDRSFYLYLFLGDRESAKGVLKNIELLAKNKSQIPRIHQYRQALENNNAKKFMESLCP